MAQCGPSPGRSSFPHLFWGCSQLNICSTSVPSCRTIKAEFCPGPLCFIFPIAPRKPELLGWWYLHQEKYWKADESQNWPNKQKPQPMSKKLFRGCLFVAVMKHICWVRLWNAAVDGKWPNWVGEGIVFIHFKLVSGLSLQQAVVEGECVEKVNDADMGANHKLWIWYLSGWHGSGHLGQLGAV